MHDDIMIRARQMNVDWSFVTFPRLCRRCATLSAQLGMGDVVDVAVLGGGASGLSAAQQLQADGHRTVVLEAAAKVGGRVLSDTTLTGHPNELGPEFVHGEADNKLIELIGRQLNGSNGKPAAQLVELNWPNYYYMGKEGAMLFACDADQLQEFQTMHDSFESLSEPDAEQHPEQSLLQYFAAQGVSSRVLDLADAIFANDYGADMSEIGLHEVIAEQGAWRYGEKYLVLQGACLQDAMEALASSLNDVRTSWPVARVELLPPEAIAARGPRVRVLSADGRIVLARRVVISVPLAVLQRGDIQFAPQLPPWKQEAIGAIRVGNALKVLLRLRKRFWPGDFYDAVCADCFFPEVWLTPAAEAMRPGAAPPFTMVGFVAGPRATRVSSLPHERLARLLLQQLDGMFGSADSPRPATDACEGFLVKDWASHPHIHGAYSHPTLGGAGKRTSLAAPVADALFFCGEACHEGVNPCIHGAMETGEACGKRLSLSLSMEAKAGRGSASQIRCKL